ncbi:hypothetical protein ACG3SL_14335 [Sphingomonas sp. CJ20]
MAEYLWSKARLNYNQASINFATCGIVIISGVMDYSAGKSSNEPIEQCQEDGNKAYNVLNMLLFANAVDNFQTYLTELVYEILLTDPRPIFGKKFPADLLFSAPDMRSLQKSVIDRFVLDLGYQNIDELSKMLDSNFGIKTLNHWLSRKRLNRYIQMRNIITHNRGIVNELYLHKSRSKSDRLGKKVNVYKPLCAQKYLSSLAEHIDVEAASKFNLSKKA